LFFFFKQKTAYEIHERLVGSEMCIRDRGRAFEQAIGFITFSPLRVDFRRSVSLGYKISGLDRISAESGLILPARFRHLA